MKNYINQPIFQRVLRHFYQVIMQKFFYVKLKHCIGQKFNENIQKTTHKRILNFLETLFHKKYVVIKHYRNQWNERNTTWNHVLSGTRSEDNLTNLDADCRSSALCILYKAPRNVRLIWKLGPSAIVHVPFRKLSRVKRFLQNIYANYY